KNKLMESQYVIGVLLSLLFLGLFSCLELVFVSTHRLHLELQSKLETWNGRILSGLIKKPGQFTGTTLIGNTVALVFYGIFMNYLFAFLLGNFLSEGYTNEPTFLILQILLSAVLVLVIAEYIPKSIFRLNPNAFLNILTLPFLLIYYLIYPVVWIIAGLSKAFVSKILKMEYPDDKPAFGITDLNS